MSTRRSKMIRESILSDGSSRDSGVAEFRAWGRCVVKSVARR